MTSKEHEATCSQGVLSSSSGDNNKPNNSEKKKKSGFSLKKKSTTTKSTYTSHFVEQLNPIDSKKGPSLVLSSSGGNAKLQDSDKKDKFAWSMKKKLSSVKFTSALVTQWDPLNSADWRDEVLSTFSSKRIKKDIMEMYKDPPDGIFIFPDEDDLTLLHALIIGPPDTPYEDGFFLFVIRFSPQYPIHPPRVRLLTTDGGKVRFNPNLYKDGKVCLSILGTWSGPSWSAVQTLSTVLLSIQSLMNEHPFQNEPGYEKRQFSTESLRYNTCIEHETIRVAVCGVLEEKYDMWPEYLMVFAKSSFAESYEHFVEVCKKKQRNDGTVMMDPFGDRRGIFQYGDLLQRLNALHEKFNKTEKGTSAEKPCCSKDLEAPQG